MFCLSKRASWQYFCASIWYHQEAVKHLYFPELWNKKRSSYFRHFMWTKIPIFLAYTWPKLAHKEYDAPANVYLLWKAYIDWQKRARYDVQPHFTCMSGEAERNCCQQLVFVLLFLSQSCCIHHCYQHSLTVLLSAHSLIWRLGDCYRFPFYPVLFSPFGCFFAYNNDIFSNTWRQYCDSWKQKCKRFSMMLLKKGGREREQNRGGKCKIV